MNLTNRNTFIAISLVIAMVVIRVFNYQIFHGINGLYADILQYPVYYLTIFGDGFFVILIAFAVYPWKKGYLSGFLIAFIITSIVVQLIKHFYPVGRPAAYIEPEQIFVIGDILRFKSFPSGHSTSALVLTRYLMQNLKSPIKWIVLIGGSLVAVSRIYIGAHFPFDVIVGGTFGFLTTHLVLFLIERREVNMNKKDYKYIPVIVPGLGLLVSFIYLKTASAHYQPISHLANLTVAFFICTYLYQIFRFLYFNFLKKSHNE